MKTERFEGFGFLKPRINHEVKDWHANPIKLLYDAHQKNYSRPRSSRTSFRGLFGLAEKRSFSLAYGDLISEELLLEVFGMEITNGK